MHCTQPIGRACRYGFRPFNQRGGRNESPAERLVCEAWETIHMTKNNEFIRIPHNAYIIVGDGRKALFLRNEGNQTTPRLKTEQVLRNDNPPTREQGSDQPGRSFASVGARRSAMEQTDWQEIGEQRFARTIADALEGLARDRDIPGFVIAAPPRTLAELRRLLDTNVKVRIIAEIDKDLTGHPVEDIERRLSAA